ncbi:MAG TPA: hypothetical protein VFQ39_00765, partial [Longimicrobium sp.]|nr:hypothetical protein [Longimicrobium sp.]
MSDPRIIDLSGLGPQRTYLQSAPERPDPKSTLYIHRTVTRHADQSEDHLVTGVHVVLAKGSGNGIWEALHVDRAARRQDPAKPTRPVRALRIHCDTLEVRGEFSVPEVDVEVFARRVVWATDDAAINTSPLPWTVDRAANAKDGKAGENGAAGRHAGSLRFFVGKMEGATGDRPRLIALGGRGQDPGAGADGVDGHS